MELSTGWIVFVVYLMEQMDKINTILAHTLGWGFAATILGAFITAAYCSDNRENFSDSWFVKNYKKFAFGISILVILNACSPSSKSVEKIAIAYGVSEILQSNTAKTVGAEISKLAGKSVAVANKKLDSILDRDTP